MLILSLSTSYIFKFDVVTVKILYDTNVVAGSLIAISQAHVGLALRRNLRSIVTSRIRFGILHAMQCWPSIC